MRAKVATARAKQSKRFGKTAKLNADMTNREVKALANLEASAKDMLDAAAEII
ncbi:hypothetical protein IPL85_03025 [Candidatus Saccharibacteria bacterium]|nr:MAG: hypothetical protein IPL85_03025 [Candidatus Saccharibacteria bacterium]